MPRRRGLGWLGRRSDRCLGGCGSCRRSGHRRRLCLRLRCRLLRRGGGRSRANLLSGSADDHEDLADLHDLPDAVVYLEDSAACWGRELDDCLVGLDLDYGLVGLDLVPFLEMPFDYGPLVDPFADIRKPEFIRYANTFRTGQSRECPSIPSSCPGSSSPRTSGKGLLCPMR